MRLMVIGGRSKLGQAICRTDADAIAMVRGQSVGETAKARIVSDYCDVSVDDFDGCDAAINCTGIVYGSSQTLEAVNTSLPLLLARQASRAGVRHFVHISSFSVYGSATLVTGDTPVAPESDYGWSKAAGETQLLNDDAVPAITVVRLPMLYGDGPSKLDELVRLWLRIGWLPCPQQDIARAMMHYELAAQVLSALARGGGSGCVAAADVVPFSYTMARDAIHSVGRPAGLLRLPSVVSSTIVSAFGNRAKSLLCNSQLDDDFNLAITDKYPSRLYPDIAAIAAP